MKNFQKKNYEERRENHQLLRFLFEAWVIRFNSLHRRPRFFLETF